MFESENALVKAFRLSSPRRALEAALIVSLLLSTVAAVAQDAEIPAEKAPLTVASFENLLESPQVLEALETRARPLDHVLDEVHSVSHYVPYDRDRHIYVTEYFSLRSVLRRPARAVIFLTGPEFRGNFWSIPVEGYNAPEMAARRGFFAYTLDYVGVGESHLPADGREINYLTQVPPVRSLVDLVRRSRRVGRVDLVGEGYGAEIASELADEAERVRSVVLSVVVYRGFTSEIEAFFSSEFEAFLRSQPDGYYMPAFLELTLASSPNEDLREYVLATQQGVYPVGPALQVFEFGFPIIDAEAARVPALILTGEFDPFPAPGDLAELARDWAGGARLEVIEGAHHVPRIEAAPIADQFYGSLFDFIDR